MNWCIGPMFSFAGPFLIVGLVLSNVACLVLGRADAFSIVKICKMVETVAYVSVVMTSDNGHGPSWMADCPDLPLLFDRFGVGFDGSATDF